MRISHHITTRLLFAYLILIPSICVAEGPHTQTGFLAENTPWKTPWYSIDSGQPGPTLVVTGGVHGNEPAGARAAEQIRHWPIQRGRLIVIPRVNKLGLDANLRWLPKFRNDKALRDPNRNFPLKNGEQPRTVPCQELWKFVQQQKPDWVVDLHEGFDFHTSNSKSVGSSLIYLNNKEIDPHAIAMQAAVNKTVTDSKRKFDRLRKSGPAKGSLVRSACDRLGCQGFILETTFKDQPLSQRTRQHRIMMSTLMMRLGMIKTSQVDLAVESPDPSRKDRMIRGQDN